jgi:hypothetical protein
MVSDEKFFAWLDGELDAAEATRVEAEVAADPRLTAMAAQHRAMLERLKGAFDTVLDQPVPDELVGTTRNQHEAKVVDFAEAKHTRELRQWPSGPQWGAMAATLAVGILVGTMMPNQRELTPVTIQGGSMYAAAALNQALDTQLASAPQGETRIGMTFHNQTGAICRTFTTPASSGLACRDPNGWRVRGLFAAPEGQIGDYRMAMGMDPNLAALVESAIAGEPFDAAQERAARQRRWRQ